MATAVTTHAVRQRLEATHEPAKVVELMRHEIGLSERDLAAATGANERTVRRWAASESLPQPGHSERIDDLRAIIVILVDSLSAQGIVNWLRARSRYLDDERPLAAIGEGAFERVRRAALAFVSGDYM